MFDLKKIFALEDENNGTKLWFLVIKPKITLAEKTVHRYCLRDLQFPPFLPRNPLLCRRPLLWEVSNRETLDGSEKRKEHFVTRKRLVERTRDILVPLKRDPLPPRPNLKYHSVWITCLAKTLNPITRRGVDRTVDPFSSIIKINASKRLIPINRLKLSEQRGYFLSQDEFTFTLLILERRPRSNRWTRIIKYSRCVSEKSKLVEAVNKGEGWPFRGCVPTIIAVFYYGTRATGSDQAVMNARCVLSLHFYVPTCLREYLHTLYTTDARPFWPPPDFSSD